MIVRMELLSDTIFGSGMSVPGAEDIGLLYDKDGFPCLKGSTVRGILREEAENFAEWTDQPDSWLDELFGIPGVDSKNGKRHVRVSDFSLPVEIRQMVMKEKIVPQDVFTSLRTFTKLDNGIAEDASLRIARCVNKGFVFYGSVECADDDRETIKEILSYIHFVGSMRSRGFGQVSVSVVCD